MGHRGAAQAGWADRGRARHGGADAATLPRGHVAALDGVRGVAVLLVLAYHFLSTAGASLAGTPAAADRALLRVSGAGWMGVDLFFVLSGFLITGILFDARGGEGCFRGFYARRVLRILPLYIAFLVVLFVGAPLVHAGFRAPFSEQVGYWLFVPEARVLLGGGSDSLHGGASHLWSLAVEEQCYLLLPALIALPLSRRQLMLVSAALVVGALAFRCGVIAIGANPVAAYRLLPARMDTLAIGGLLALALRSEHDAARVRRALPVAALAVGAVVAALFALRSGLRPTDPWVQTVGYSAQAALGGALVAAAALARLPRPAQRVLARRPMTALGRYSYGLYILHVPLVLLLGWRVREAGGLPAVAGSYAAAMLLFSAAAMTLSAAAAWLSFHALERRFLRLKSRITYGASLAAAAALRAAPAGEAGEAAAETQRRAA